MRIRRFTDKDAEKVSKMIIRTEKTTNSKDYSEEWINALEKRAQPSDIIERAGWTHFYVAEENDTIIGCGAIGPFWGSETESSLFNIFVLPEYQGKGIGRKIIETLEQDEYFLRAKRVEVPASITAVNFYRKLGYDYKYGVDHPDEEQIIGLEKFRYCSSVIGSFVTVTIDRPIGSLHPEHRDIYYPINYGYVEGVKAPNGEWQDAYILGVYACTSRSKALQERLSRSFTVLTILRTSGLYALRMSRLARRRSPRKQIFKRSFSRRKSWFNMSVNLLCKTMII